MKRVQSLLPINCADRALMTIDFSLPAEISVLTSVIISCLNNTIFNCDYSVQLPPYIPDDGVYKSITT